MNLSLRFIVLLFLLVVVPIRSLANDDQRKKQNYQIILSDSIVEAQLKVVDSLSMVNAYKADSILVGLLENKIVNKKLWEEAVYLKWQTMSWLSQHREAVAFLESIISNGGNYPRFYMALSNEYRFLFDYSKSIASAQEAHLIYERNDNYLGIVDANNFLIEAFGEIKMFDEARVLFLENLKLCNSLNYKEGLVKTYIEYGESLVFENPILASEYLHKGMQIAESGDNKIECGITIFLIRFYINTSQLELAKKKTRNYLKYCISNNYQMDSNVLTLMAHIFSLENDIDSTIYFNQKALKIRTLSRNKKMITSSYLNLAGNYLVKEEIERANEYLNKAERVVLTINNPNMLLTYYRGKVRYFEYIQDYNQAYLYSQKEIDLSQELTNLRHQSVLAKLNTSFEIQQENILLERELENRKVKTRLLASTLSILSLLLGGGYLIYLYRKKNYSYLKLVSKAIHIEKRLSISDKERLKFQSVFDYSVTGILILDKNGFIQYANRKSKALLDQSDESHVLRIPFVDFFESKNKISVQKALSNVFIENKADKGFKVQIINKRSFHWLDISFAPLVFEHEDDTILVTLIDVTQEVINIGSEQKQKRELQTLLDSVTESILFIQRNGKIKALNNTAAGRLESTPKDLNGANYFDSLPKLLRKKRTTMFEKVLLYKKPLIELEMVGNHNNIVSMYPNINSAGEVDYISEFVQDITERRIAEEQIDNLKQRVLRSQMNPHFIFNSLTSIQSFVIRNDSTMASKYLNSFARLIRLILESSRHDYISLKSKIEII